MQYVYTHGDDMKSVKDSSVGILDQIIADYKQNPVDLLEIGDVGEEYTYLVNARRSYRRTILDLVDLFPERKSEHGTPIKVLEVGSYLGVVSITLAQLGFSVTALDIPEFMRNDKLRERYHRNGIATFSANLRDCKIPAAAEEFDLVVMCETLEHLNFNPVPILLEINRVTKLGGIFYLSLPNLTSLVNRTKLLFGRSIHNPMTDFFAQFSDRDNMIVGLHWREYTAAEIRELLYELGFGMWRQYFFTPNQASFPAKLIYRFAPSLQQNQTAIARKEYFPELKLSFCDAVAPLSADRGQ